MSATIRLPIVERLVQPRFPFTGFPNGWFHVCTSAELPRGAVKSLTWCGRKVVAFRGHDGVARVVDGYCPHLGADLGGGRVVGNTLACPFHGWQFDGEGRCVHIPYAGKIPKRAQTEGWPVREVNGLILAWHHAAGEPPDWDVPELDEARDDAWTKLRVRHRWTIRSHPQDILENVVDTAHFGTVHGDQTPTAASEELEIDGPRLRHRLTPELHSPIHERLGRPGPRGTIDATCHGLGAAFIRFSTNRGFPLRMVSVFSLRPIDGERVELLVLTSLARYRSRLLDLLFTQLTIRNSRYTIEQDLPIFESKRYVEAPPLCAGDGPIMRYRRWAKQFYGRA